MQKLMKRFHKNEKGFTLVELMVVVVIIGILVAIAIPIYGAVTTNAANSSHEANIRTLIGAANMALAQGAPDGNVTWTGGTDGTATFSSTATTDLAADWNHADYIPDWPTVPGAADLASTDSSVPVTGNADPNSLQTYNVTIGSDGSVTVTIQ